MSQTPVHLIATSSQTVGPFFHFGLAHHATLGCLVRPDTPGERIRLKIRVFDGDGAPLPDALVELWQADADGVYVRPDDPKDLALAPGLLWIRPPADGRGRRLYLRDDPAGPDARRAARAAGVAHQRLPFRAAASSGRSTRGSISRATRRSIRCRAGARARGSPRSAAARDPAIPADGSSTSGFRATARRCSSISDCQNMPSRLIDSLATTDALAEIFSDRSMLQAMLDFEAALAAGEASRVSFRSAPPTPFPPPPGRGFRCRGNRAGSARVGNGVDCAREGADGARAGADAGRARRSCTSARRVRTLPIRRCARDQPGARDPRRRPSRVSSGTLRAVVRSACEHGHARADAASTCAADHVRPQGRGLGGRARARLEAARRRLRRGERAAVRRGFGARSRRSAIVGSPCRRALADDLGSAQSGSALAHDRDRLAALVSACGIYTASSARSRAISRC